MFRLHTNWIYVYLELTDSVTVLTKGYSGWLHCTFGVGNEGSKNRWSLCKHLICQHTIKLTPPKDTQFMISYRLAIHCKHIEPTISKLESSMSSVTMFRPWKIPPKDPQPIASFCLDMPLQSEIEGLLSHVRKWGCLLMAQVPKLPVLTKCQQ